MGFGSLIDDFGLKMLSLALNEDKFGHNFVFSPSSIYMVMASVLVGAKLKTADQLTKLLGVDFSNLLIDKKIELEEGKDAKIMFGDLLTTSLQTSKIHNKIFSACKLHENYVSVVKSVFKTEMQEISFQPSETACSIINEWIKTQTEGKIQKVLSSNDLSALTKYVIVNTIFFKSQWLNTFVSASTFKFDFYITPTETVKVMMMRANRKELYWESMNNYSVLMLPFKGESSYGVYVLPDEEKQVKDILPNINGKVIRSWFEEGSKVEVSMQIPRMKISKLFSVKSILQKLGAVDIFDDTCADLSGISNEPTYLSEVFHSANIELDETGVVAAAATVAVANLRCARPQKTVTFIANRPFLFLIYNTDADVVHFSSYVRDPTVA